jgi:hypothetical protein
MLPRRMWVKMWSAFNFQDAFGDGDDESSDAILVVVDDPIIMDGLAVGDEVAVNGRVEEYSELDNGLAAAFPITRLLLSSHLIITRDNPLPVPILIGGDDGGRRWPPTTTRLVDSLMFWSALESMRVTLISPLTCVAPTNEDGKIYAVMKNAVLSPRGTLTIDENDFNPERIQIDASASTVRVDVGTILGNVTGIVRYVLYPAGLSFSPSCIVLRRRLFFTRALSLNAIFFSLTVTPMAISKLCPLSRWTWSALARCNQAGRRNGRRMMPCSLAHTMYWGVVASMTNKNKKCGWPMRRLLPSI